MPTVGTWKDSALDARVLEQISIDAPWALLERFNTLHRLSGSADEAVAVDYLTGKLSEWDVQHTVHHPKLLISWPGLTTLRATGPNGKSYTVKTVSFSPSTNGEEIVGELAYVPGREPSSLRDMFRTETGRQPIEELDLRGKIVISEGRGMGARNLDLAASGALAAIMVNPGERIHEGIATNSWGSPDLRSLGRTPAIPIITINNPEGCELIELTKAGQVEVAFSNQVDTAWRQIPITVAEIPGALVPEEFVLLHGHLDSWHVGIGDNATGNATLLEIARVFQANQDKLARSLRIAWWSGHSHGRYAGSTWYADAFAIDLMEHCVSHINCDSPGCRWATVYEDVMWMPEAEELSRAAIRDAVGQEATTMRPLRAGDNSFNNLGISLYFMGSSWMPADLMAEKGYHPVAGCGGNIAWHTEDDTLEIADPEILLKDIKIYALAVLRTLNAPVHPLDYRAAVADIRSHVESYQEAAGAAFDFGPSLAELDALQAALNEFYSALEANPPADASAARAANQVQRKLARELVGLSFSQDGRFRQDTARSYPPLPEYQPARQLSSADGDMQQVIGVDLMRAQSRFQWACREARREVERFLNGG